MFKEAKAILLNVIGAHPNLAAFGIGLTITMAIGAASGMLDPHQHVAFAGSRGGPH